MVFSTADCVVAKKSSLHSQKGHFFCILVVYWTSESAEETGQSQGSFIHKQPEVLKGLSQVGPSLFRAPQVKEKARSLT